MTFKKVFGLLTTLAIFSTCTFISENVQAASISSNQVQVSVKGNGLVKDKNVTATAYLQDDSFNPLTATNEELISHGYPTRPTNQQALVEWKKAVSTKLIKPEFSTISMPWHNSKGLKKSNIIEDIKSPLIKTKKSEPNAELTESRNWSGYEEDTHVTGSQGYWKVPFVSAPALLDTPAYSSQWTGIGGGTDNPNTSLIQAGDAAQVLSNGSADYYTWIELFNTSYDNGYPLEISNLPCSPGDTIFVSIETSYSSGSNASFMFFVSNETLDESVIAKVTIADNNNSGVCAEWISENNLGTYNPRTSTGGSNYIPFWGSAYQTSMFGNFTGITNNDSNLYKDSLVNCMASGSIPVTNNLLSEPTDLSGSSFNINWYNYY